MTRRRQSLGREGEARAARYLEARGYQIVARNVRAERVEIDLVAIDGRRLVFVEVKTRRADGRSGMGRHTHAAEAVDPRKQARLRRGAMAWLDATPEIARATRGLRFDVVTCLVEGVPGSRNENTALPSGVEGGERWSFELWRSAF